MFDKSLFGLKPFEILEEVERRLRQLPISEKLKELEIENVRKMLINGPFLRPGMGFSTYPLGFFEELFWVALLEGEKAFRVKVDWKTEGKPFFWIDGETSFEEEPITLKEFFEEFESKLVVVHLLREKLKDLKEPLLIDWNEKELLLAEELIEDGTYLFKTSQDGIAFKKIG